MSKNRNTARPGTKTSAKGAKAVQAMRGGAMSRNLKITIGLIAVAVTAVLGAMAISATGNESSTAATDQRLVRADSHRLSTSSDGKVTVVEFLDFECEACGAAYPAVEKLRKEYNGKINYVVRYFPLPAHRNADNAARAVQAAANQNKFEAMYTKMFDTQPTWGDQQVDHTATFEQFATEIGLDVARYRTDVTSQATSDRVQTDRKDGLALEVQGTPTFYINGTKLDGQPSYDNLKAAVDKALNA